MFRVLGWGLLAMAVAAVVHDGLAWWSEGAFHLLRLGDLWSHLDGGSLIHSQDTAQGPLPAVVWSWIMRPLLMAPVLPVVVIVGFACLWAGERRGAGGDSGFFVSSRPPRRRRSRGLS